MKVANQLNRNSIGIEIIRDLETIIRQKVNSNNLEIVERDKGKYRFVTLDYIEKRKNVVN
jgi:DNA modification methylase